MHLTTYYIFIPSTRVAVLGLHWNRKSEEEVQL
jgi:hypothetical protein